MQFVSDIVYSNIWKKQFIMMNSGWQQDKILEIKTKKRQQIKILD